MKRHVTSLIKVMNVNKILSKPIVQKAKQKVVKENLIISLREDMSFYEVNKTNNNQTLNDVACRRLQLEEDGKTLQVYCQKMKDILNEFIDRVEFYEKEIENYKHERKMIIMSNEAIIKQKHNDKRELMKQNDILNSKLEFQINQLKEMSIQTKELEEKKEVECKVFQEKEAVDIKRYQDFYMKYKKLLGNFNIYEQEFNVDDDVMQMINRKNTSQSVTISLEEFKMKLNEIKLKNQLLQKDYDDYTMKIFEYNQHSKYTKKNRLYDHHYSTIATNASNNNYSNQMTNYK